MRYKGTLKHYKSETNNSFVSGLTGLSYAMGVIRIAGMIGSLLGNIFDSKKTNKKLTRYEKWKQKVDTK